MNQTRVTRHVRAPREAVYRALLDADAVAAWRVPNGMTAAVHEFDARRGGRFRISLTYVSPCERGKTTAQTDTYHGRFVEMVPNERVVEKVEFETSDPALAGVMRIPTTAYSRRRRYRYCHGARPHTARSFGWGQRDRHPDVLGQARGADLATQQLGACRHARRLHQYYQ